MKNLVVQKGGEVGYVLHSSLVHIINHSLISPIRNAGTERAAELQKIVDEFIVRRTNDLLAKHLPDKVVSVVCVKLTPLAELYEHLLAAETVSLSLDRQAHGYEYFLLSIGNDKTLNNNNNRNVTKCKRPEKGVQSSESCLYRCSTCQKLEKHDSSTV